MRRGAMVGMFGVMIAAVVFVVGRATGRREIVAMAPRASVAPPAASVHAETTETLLTADSDLAADPEGGGRSFSLKNGGARFVVAHDEAHPFRVHVGRITVEDVGTIFTVRRLSDASAEVAVDEGRVRVVVDGRETLLGAGAKQTFEAASAPVEAPSAARHQPVPAWRSLAENGQYREAYESLQRAGRTSVRDDTGELLLAADAARLSGHPAESVPLLNQVVERHGSDPRAGLAAFTLGRVLLEELGRPSEAVAAFDRARRGGGPLAEDALAREVEAMSRAGDTSGARSLALEYQQLYPQGHRARSVAKFGGLE